MRFLNRIPQSNRNSIRECVDKHKIFLKYSKLGKYKLKVVPFPIVIIFPFFQVSRMSVIDTENGFVEAFQRNIVMRD
jgi:hypothetical protein